MYSKRSGKNDEPDSRPVRTSDRLRRRPNIYGRPFMYYSPSMLRPKKIKMKKRTAASQIAKMLHSGSRPVRSSNSNSAATSLRRSTRKRRLSTNLEDYTDSSGTEDDDLMRPRYRRSRSQIDNRASIDTFTSSKRKKNLSTRLLPRREGLRPRRSERNVELIGESDDEAGSSGEKDETENGNDMEEDNDAEDGDGQDEDDGEDEGEGEEREEEEGDDEEGEEEEEEEQEGRRRYDLRTRSEVHRLSREESGKQRQRSPRRILKRGGSRVHKRHRINRADDSDDSLLVDELDQGPSIPWGRGGNRSNPPWLFGGLDIHGTTAWGGLNVAAASGWSHQNDNSLINSSFGGVQSAGPSSKGGADIQPLQVDESVSFDEIGGLSEHIDSLKEMVFFPLLYPDFFASYNITPPRGVLLCGPPGTGKTLIARALACAASKAGQKVSFYMRKGADVLSKWVGEAERQLKMLFEEAQRNQPSIIFFDEIDGLAPVRSSKQEQIHNSIVSTLLALMDGLDSRGQVVLIGATNRVDAIDGALRRPGRFDREFNFSLPGCEARAEILNIHTRKWKQSPSIELKSELAASCVGYCGADLKALCTEAAIRAFREKYPQVYTSDDKFLIDVDSVMVEKHHFLEAMSTITPAAHRGSIVHSRPLSSVVAPCLQKHFKKTMNIISDIFPAVDVSYQSAKLTNLSYGSAIPLMYRPRLLLCGDQGVGMDHLGPAILHELEKFPVHSLGLPSLLSDPSAKTPEEALVHIFGEARRNTPSILFCPQFNLWWENAHDQLKAVLETLLEGLPSDFPILFLGVSTKPLSDMDEEAFLVFSRRNIYEVDKPSTEDRSSFFDRLTEAALSLLSEENSYNSNNLNSVPDLPKAPKVDNSPKASELKAKAEAEQHSLRRLRMCLRDICNRILYDKRFSSFHYPVLDEDAPNYHSIIQNPMDIATLLQRVDSGKYITCKMFLEDFDLILVNAKKYNGDDYNGARIVSRACELRDSVHGMLSQIDPALVAFCDKIASEGGPMPLPNELLGSSFPTTPVVHLATNTTRASARLRNAQPEVNLDQSYEALKRSKKNVDVANAAIITEEAPRVQDTSQSIPSLDPEVEDPDPKQSESTLPDTNTVANMDVRVNSELVSESRSVDVTMSDLDYTDKVQSIKQLYVERTDNYGVPQLELLYTRLMRGIFKIKASELVDDLRSSILKYLQEFAENEANF